jgi:mRNA-degrading endonuclease toxin of MazEF toxin-antitoxin module
MDWRAHKAVLIGKVPIEVMAEVLAKLNTLLR